MAKQSPRIDIMLTDKNLACEVAVQQHIDIRMWDECQNAFHQCFLYFSLSRWTCSIGRISSFL